MSVSEAEIWFADEWAEPEPELAPATFNSVIEACSELLNEHDLAYIREHQLDLNGLLIYLEGWCFARKKNKNNVLSDFLREKSIATPVITYPDSRFDRLSNVLENHGGKLTLGVLVMATAFQGAIFNKQTAAWPTDTKAKLAQAIEPTAQRIATKLETIRLYHPNEIKVGHTSTPGEVSLELDSFETGENFYQVTAYMSKGEDGVPNPKAVSEVDVYAGGYINDGSDSYDGKQALRQEVDIYSTDDSSGAPLWEAEDWQWGPGSSGDYSDASVHIDAIDWSKVSSLDSVSVDKPVVKEAAKENAIWSRYAEIEADAAFNGDIQTNK